MLTIQQDVIDQLTETFKQIIDNPTSENNSPHVFAVSGDRGLGKSTILKELRAQISKMPGFRVLDLIDASTIPHELGIFAAVAQKLYSMFSANKSLSESSTQAFHSFFEKAIGRETSFRSLAKEMAMSPEHYTKMIHRWAEEQNKDLFGSSPFFENFLKQEGDHRDAWGTRQAVLVVFLDDMDLAPADMVQNWARVIINEPSASNRIFWVLSFNKHRLIQSLSPIDRCTPTLDLAVGNSVLSKLLPVDQHMELQPWSPLAKCQFKPLNMPHGPSLFELLKKKGYEALACLLPITPRKLLELYSWLLQAKNAYMFYSELDVLMQKLAELNDDTELRSLLQRTLVHELVYLFEFDSDEIYNATHLRIAIEADSEVLNLPLPLVLLRQHSSIRNYQYLEAFLNSTMKRNEGPFQVLQIPFLFQKAKAILSQFVIVQRISLSRFLEREQEKAGALLTWGEFQFQPEAKNFILEIGPLALWDCLYGQRKYQGDQILSKTWVNLPDFGKKLEDTYNHCLKHQPILPDDLRGLLYFLSNLELGPWEELSLTRSFWSPLSVGLIGIAIYLSALADCIWPDLAVPEETPAGFYWPKTAFSNLKSLGDFEVAEGFRSLIAFFKTLQAPTSPENADHYSPLAAARASLFVAFQNTLKLHSIRILADLEDEDVEP